MTLTPEDVRDVRFHRPPLEVKGYDEGPVDAFLERIAGTLRGEDTITAQDVLKVRFPAAAVNGNGYECEEVELFLDLVVTVLEKRALAMAGGLTAEDVAEVGFRPSKPGAPGYDERQVDAFLARVQATLRGRDQLQPQDVQAVRFDAVPVGAGGYDQGGVDAFLDQVAASLARARPRLVPVAGAPAPGTLTAQDVHDVGFHLAGPGARGYDEDEVDAFLDRIEGTLLGADVLTPLDVRRVRFTEHAGGGYDLDEVDAFLNLVEVCLRKRYGQTTA
ncbi:DivIVA domain-containing protein [Crossiella equi]|uniref:Cell wall synthesis protein Wag31 n=1 Tax=Crossiella equi TaxID=130796 RepID=A0ABS5AHP6_9PSEU|nr:DivIVA domain-containing protein [Crossiella equi]MBP2476098.1 DivIVA domain-containing protein [Crossiella equi]